MNNFWNQNGPSPDSPLEYVNGEWQTADSFVHVQEGASDQTQQDHDIIEEIVQQTREEMLEEDDDEDFSDVLSDARLRLEQGKLYEMIMNHDLFSGVDADPRAAKTVQKQIRKWAKEQMEIMLGMRKETSKVERLEIDFPFNSVEVEVLKKLAFTATKGASQNSDNYVPEVKKVVEEVPVVSKKNTLNSIGHAQKTQQKPATPLQKKKEPIKRSAPPAKAEVNEKGLLTGKSLEEMTPEEKEQKIKETIERQRGKKAFNPDASPQPSYEQMEAIAQAQVSRALGGNQNLSAAIVAALNKNR